MLINTPASGAGEGGRWAACSQDWRCIFRYKGYRLNWLCVIAKKHRTLECKHFLKRSRSSTSEGLCATMVVRGVRYI